MVIEFISQAWHWSVSGLMIVLVMFFLLYLGQRFGVSSSFQTMCSIGGAGKFWDYFDYDWRKQDWLLVFVLGSVIGGAVALNFFPNPEPIQLSQATVADLQALGISVPQSSDNGQGFMPPEIFNTAALGTLPGIILMLGGGFLIGFGTRYAGGCTSGHAISGLSNLQLPSLVAVIGFFIGGLTSTFILLPWILG